MLKQTIQFAYPIWQQQRHQPQYRLYQFTQTILMVFIVTLSLVASNIQHYLNHNLNSLLGADVVISQQHPLNAEQRQALSKLSEQMTLTRQLNFTITFGQQWQRASIKGVDQHYPLQGQLKTSNTLGAPALSSQHGPKLGEIWLEPRLITGLGIDIGQNISLGDHQLTLTRALLHEPDRLMEGHNVTMRALVNHADLQAIMQTDDHVLYRYLLQANSQQTDAIIQWQRQYLPAAQLYHKQGNHPLSLFWQRTENVLGLASMVLFFMAAIAIDLLTQIRIKQEQYFSAICLSLGASRTMGFVVAIVKWLLELVSHLPLVIVCATGLSYFIIAQLSATFTELQWLWQPLPMLQSIAMVWCIFAVFQAPIWVALWRTSISVLFKQSSSNQSQLISKISAVLVLAMIAYLYSDNGLLTSMMVVTISSCIAIMMLASWVVLTLGERITAPLSGLVPFALFMMKQRIVSKSTQIIGVGLCAFLLLFTLMLMRDLGETMQAYQRQHDGNLLISQATSSQMADVETWAQQHQVPVRQHKPYLYASVTAINQTAIASAELSPSETLATLTRPIRLHWQQAVPSNNRVVEGHWWPKDSQNWQQLSVEQEVMTDLNLAIGDVLTLNIANNPIDFTISASHVFKPGQGSITFWMQAPIALIEHVDAPQYAMASLELQAKDWTMLPTLWQRHPSLRMVSLQEMTANFDRILAMITKVITGFSLMIILLAVVVILASVQALQSKENRKNSLILSFGFDRKTCQRLTLIEWLVTAIIAALGAIAGTSIAGQLIYQSQFSLHYQPNWWWLLSTISVIITLVTLIGLHASKRSLSADIRTLYHGAC
ncbi:ABC transporter permease [Shewanella waksmanii]|uniref:ABC transporter permease n=1 Tax=Shewanella waksmanii TaxID=213783 RepID=UPI00373576B4